MSKPTATELADHMYDFIKGMGGGVTFVQLEGVARQHGVDPTGDLCLTGPPHRTDHDPNIWLWAGVSTEFAEAISELNASGRVIPTPTTPLVYHADGKALSLPVVQRPPRGGYKDPHWIPAVFAAA